MVKTNWLSRMVRRLAEPKDLSAAIHTRAIGTSGTESYSGYPSEEYLYSLRGYQRAKVFDKMRRSDYQVKMCLSAVKNPIRSATWEVHPGEKDNDEAKHHAEFIEHVLFNGMDDPWSKFLTEVTTFYEFGHSVFEVTHKAVLDHPTFGSYNGIKSLGWRSPKTIDRFNLDKETGRLKSITQQADGDLASYVDIPAEYLLYFSVDREGSNYEGISWLRSCYGSYIRKCSYLKDNAIGISKFAIPTPIAKVPSGKEGTPEFDSLIEALQVYTSNENNYLTIPEGWEIDLKTNTYDPSKVEYSVDAEDKRITKAFLANFLELGMGTTGSFALSNDLSDFFLSGLEYIADEISEPINCDLIPSLIKMNFGPQSSYPKLKATGISDKAGKELAEIVSMFVSNKVITPDDKLEDHFRKRLGLSPRSDEGVRTPSAPPQFSEKRLYDRIKLAQSRR